MLPELTCSGNLLFQFYQPLKGKKKNMISAAELTCFVLSVRIQSKGFFVSLTLINYRLVSFFFCFFLFFIALHRDVISSFLPVCVIFNQTEYLFVGFFALIINSTKQTYIQKFHLKWEMSSDKLSVCLSVYV